MKTMLLTLGLILAHTLLPIQAAVYRTFRTSEKPLFPNFVGPRCA